MFFWFHFHLFKWLFYYTVNPIKMLKELTGFSPCVAKIKTSLFNPACMAQRIQQLLNAVAKPFFLCYKPSHRHLGRVYCTGEFCVWRYIHIIRRGDAASAGKWQAHMLKPQSFMGYLGSLASVFYEWLRVAAVFGPLSLRETLVLKPCTLNPNWHGHALSIVTGPPQLVIKVPST